MGTSSKEPLKLAERSPAFRILLVDDTPLNRKVAVSQLKYLGFEEIDCAENGQVALHLLQKNTYDLVLMDCRMPELDGYETTEIIRNQELDGQHQIIVAMTANVLDDERQRCVDVGMDDYILKPITLDALKALFERCSEDYLEKADPVAHKHFLTIKADAPIDFERLEHMLGDDPPLHQMVLQELPKIVPGYLVQLETAIANGNMIVASEEAHRLKGSLSMAGVKELPELCRSLEKSADKANMEEVCSLTATIKTQLEAVFGFIRDYYRDQEYLGDL